MPLTLSQLKAMLAARKAAPTFSDDGNLAAKTKEAKENGWPTPRVRKFAGMDVVIENPKGSTRSGVDKGGKPWSVQMQCDYGYLSRANGEDGEGLDVFLGPDERAENVYVVHQNEPDTGRYDEDKCMAGFASPEAAKAAYLANYSTPKFFRSMTIVPLARFKEMLTTGKPGGAHWKKKQGRAHETAAMFSASGAPSLLQAAAEELWSTCGDMVADGNAVNVRDLIRREAPAMARKYGLDAAKLTALALSFESPRTKKVPNPDASIRVLNKANRGEMFDAATVEDEKDEVWRTLGAHVGADGKRHGGTHVLLNKKTGEIDKGPPALAHHNVKDLPKAQPKPPMTLASLKEMLRRPENQVSKTISGKKSRPPFDLKTELWSSLGLGRLTIPTEGGKVDPHLEQAYRRIGADYGITIGQFKVDPQTGRAVAPIDRPGPGPKPGPFDNLPPTPGASTTRESAQQPQQASTTRDAAQLLHKATTTRDQAQNALPQTTERKEAQNPVGNIPDKSSAAVENHPLYDRKIGAPIEPEQPKPEEQASPQQQPAMQPQQPAQAIPQQAPQAAPGTLPEFPHQVTAADYLAAHKQHQEASGKPVIASQAIKEHEEAVANALKEGHHVPPEVLKDYAHLQPPHEHQKQAIPAQVAEGNAGAPQVAQGAGDQADFLKRRRERIHELLTTVPGMTQAQAIARVTKEMGNNPNAQPVKMKGQRVQSPAKGQPNGGPATNQPAGLAPAAQTNGGSDQRSNAGIRPEATGSVRGESPVSTPQAAPNRSGANETPEALPAVIPAQDEIEREYGLMQEAYRRGDMAAFDQHRDRAYKMSLDREAAEKGQQPKTPRTPRQPKQPKEKIPPSKAEIQRQLVDAWKQQGGGSTVEDDKALAPYARPYTFLRDPRTKSGLPGEVERFLEGRGQLKARKLFEVTDDPTKADGSTALGDMGEDKYFDLIDRRMGGESRQALEHARKSQDPHLRFLAAVHDTMPQRADRVRQEQVDPAELQPGTEFKINDIPVKVKEDENGERVLHDGGDIPETPVDALAGQKIPMDRGTRQERPLPEVGENPFGEVMGEPPVGAPPEEPPAQGKPVASGDEEPERTSSLDTPEAIEQYNRIQLAGLKRHPESDQEPLPEVEAGWELDPESFRHQLSQAAERNISGGEASREHERVVHDAIERGESVPDHVRAAYGYPREEEESDKPPVALPPPNPKPAVTPPAVAEANQPEVEQPKPAPTPPPSDVDTSRQLGLYARDAQGNAQEVGERPGQANLFNPSKYRAAEPEKTGEPEREFKNFDPNATPSMFPAKEEEEKKTQQRRQEIRAEMDRRIKDGLAVPYPNGKGSYVLDTLFSQKMPGTLWDKANKQWLFPDENSANMAREHLAQLRPDLKNGKPATSAEKEPWQKTLGEALGKPDGKVDWVQNRDPNSAAGSAHRAAVEQAIAEGKPVPSNVLADYPWLEAKRNIKPYADSLRGMSDKELNAESKRTANALNAWSRKGGADYHEHSERFNAVQREMDARREKAASEAPSPVESLKQKMAEKKAPHESWQMTKEEHRKQENTPKLQAISEAIKSGKPIQLNTHLRGTPLRNPEFLRMAKDGNIQMRERSGWVTLLPNQVDQLASQAGVKIPAFEDQVTHRGAVQDAMEAGKPVPQHVRDQYPELSQQEEPEEAAPAPTVQDPAIGKKIRARVNELTASGTPYSDAILQAHREFGIGQSPVEKLKQQIAATKQKLAEKVPAEDLKQQIAANRESAKLPPDVAKKLKARIKQIQEAAPYGTRMPFVKAMEQAKREMGIGIGGQPATAQAATDTPAIQQLKEKMRPGSATEKQRKKWAQEEADAKAKIERARPLRDQLMAEGVPEGEANRRALEEEGKSEKSKGHVAFIGDYEYYRASNGDLYRAPTSAPVMPDGSRSGRFESTRETSEQALNNARDYEKAMEDEKRHRKMPLSEAMNELIKGNGGLTRSGDYVNSLLKDRSAAELKDLLDESRKSTKPGFQRWIGGAVIGELRARGIDPQSIPHREEASPEETAPSRESAALRANWTNPGTVARGDYIEINGKNGNRISAVALDEEHDGKFRIRNENGISREANISEIADRHEGGALMAGPKAHKNDQSLLHARKPQTPDPNTHSDKVETVEQGMAAAEQQQKAQRQKLVEDFGEKIGGARKDLAVPLGPRPKNDTGESDERPAWRKRYHVAQDAKTGRYFLGDPKSGHIIGRDTYATKEEAEKVIPLREVSRNHRVRPEATGANPTHGIYRQITDRKRALVKGGFPTEKDALTYMAQHPEEIINHKFPMPERPWLDKIQREGDQVRQGNVTPKKFHDEFGFRGGEFGNWNQGGDGQAALNHAYDGLHDLSKALNLPPKAISLNGDLSIAFGARGHGGTDSARAHYERDYGVINLTKIKGAGALAHEWFHALDHYFGRQTGKASNERTAEGTFKTHGREDDYLSHGAPYNNKGRKEIADAFKHVMDTIHAKSIGKKMEPEFEKKRVEGQSKFVKQTLDELKRNMLIDNSRYNSRWKAPTTEQLAEWDKLADKIMAGDVGQAKTVERKGSRSSRGRDTYEPIEQLNAIYKKITGRSFTAGEKYGSELYWKVYHAKDAVKRLKEAEQGTIQTKTVATDFYDEARKIDNYRASDYWQTKHEMAARAFESYVHDKLASKQGRSDYLIYGADNKYYAAIGMKPYPEAEERKEIYKAFDKLFETIKTQERKDAKGNTHHEIFSADAILADAERAIALSAELLAV